MEYHEVGGQMGSALHPPLNECNMFLKVWPVVYMAFYWHYGRENKWIFHEIAQVNVYKQTCVSMCNLWYSAVICAAFCKHAFILCSRSSSSVVNSSTFNSWLTIALSLSNLDSSAVFTELCCFLRTRVSCCLQCRHWRVWAIISMPVWALLISTQNTESR